MTHEDESMCPYRGSGVRRVSSPRSSPRPSIPPLAECGSAIHISGGATPPRGDQSPDRARPRSPVLSVTEPITSWAVRSCVAAASPTGRGTVRSEASSGRRTTRRVGHALGPWVSRECEWESRGRASRPRPNGRRVISHGTARRVSAWAAARRHHAARRPGPAAHLRFDACRFGAC